jgi:hypothetical protein
VAEAQSKAQPDPVLGQRVADLMAHASQEAEARQQGQQVLWFRPAGPAVALTDYEAMTAPFDSKASSDAYAQATGDARTPGSTGDLAATTLAIDYLAILERAYRQRHTMTRPRAMAHMLGRKLGHGNSRGPLATGVLTYLEGILREAKA